MNASDRHAAIAAGFASTIEATRDWAAATPVPGWTARDVVEHLLAWPTPLLAAWAGTDLADDAKLSLSDRWAARTAQIQAILDSSAGDLTLGEGPFAGQPLASTLDRIYTADVFMHTWDLARANDNPTDHLEATYAWELLEGLRSIEPAIRASGQYGPATTTPHADPVSQLMAFVGRQVP